MPSKPPKHSDKMRQAHPWRYQGSQQQQDRARGSATQRGYGSRWRRARRTFLKKHPLCVYCLNAGRTQLATVVDHIVPHKGDKVLFWDKKNWQPLCQHCHDSVKRREENQKGY